MNNRVPISCSEATHPAIALRDRWTLLHFKHMALLQERDQIDKDLIDIQAEKLAIVATLKNQMLGK